MIGHNGSIGTMDETRADESSRSSSTQAGVMKSKIPLLGCGDDCGAGRIAPDREKHGLPGEDGSKPDIRNNSQSFCPACRMRTAVGAPIYAIIHKFLPGPTRPLSGIGLPSHGGISPLRCINDLLYILIVVSSLVVPWMVSPVPIPELTCFST